MPLRSGTNTLTLTTTTATATNSVETIEAEKLEVSGFAYVNGYGNEDGLGLQNHAHSGWGDVFVFRDEFLGVMAIAGKRLPTRRGSAALAMFGRVATRKGRLCTGSNQKSPADAWFPPPVVRPCGRPCRPTLPAPNAPHLS